MQPPPVMQGGIPPIKGPELVLLEMPAAVNCFWKLDFPQDGHSDRKSVV